MWQNSHIKASIHWEQFNKYSNPKTNSRRVLMWCNRRDNKEVGVIDKCLIKQLHHWYELNKV